MRFTKWELSVLFNSISIVLMTAQDLKKESQISCPLSVQHIFIRGADVQWRQFYKEYGCLHQCWSFSNGTKIDSASLKPKMRELVFRPFQNFVDCTVEKRQITAACKLRCKFVA
ncbi:uncharacterized protein LOC132205647 [Neocloeon triangulifer]|uniref:uncharacterized protein LOC132205647 n=1 Tax=Neocloeon triangulifer TaxID=2078957 RepID=UPI00286F7A71|nr:uncharacterized protein LOC132205647 [Neocloeon triangulifer]